MGRGGKSHPRGMPNMRIAKPILMVTTPLGVGEGIYECYKLAGGLVFIMVAMVGVCVVALATVIAAILAACWISGFRRLRSVNRNTVAYFRNYHKQIGLMFPASIMTETKYTPPVYLFG